MTLIQPYFVAETIMPGETGFDSYGASKSFNVLAEYLFGKVLMNHSLWLFAVLLFDFWILFCFKSGYLCFQ